jgi:hypothetical protein
MNGWVRLGIVASVAWAVGAYFYGMSEQDWASRSFEFCHHIADTFPTVDEAIKVHARCDADFKRELPVAMRDLRGNAAVLALLPIPVFWIVTLLCIAVVKWVRRGFRSKAPVKP